MEIAFELFDKENTGFISVEEVIKLDQQVQAVGIGKQWEELLLNLDLAGNGRIDFHDFCCAAIDHHKVLTEANLK